MSVRARERAATPQARRALEALSGLAGSEDFYLAGGTALALRLGHRVSVDLDFFSASNTLDFEEREALKTGLRARRPFRVREEKDGTLKVVLEDTEVSFFRYPYLALKAPARWQGIYLASLEDIGAMKLGAVIGRGARKDFLDLYALRREVPLPRLLRLAQRKFKDSGDFSTQALKALVYFDDAEKEPMPELLRPIRWPEVKAYFEKEVPRIAARYVNFSTPSPPWGRPSCSPNRSRHDGASAPSGRGLGRGG